MADAALDAYLDGRWGLAGQGFVAQGYVRNPTIGVGGGGAGLIDVNIVSPIPLQVEQINAPLLPIETSMAALGVIVSPTTGEPIARVMLSRMTDERTGVVTEVVSAYYEDGTVTTPYIGPWVIEGDCTAATPAGVLTNWG